VFSNELRVIQLGTREDHGLIRSWYGRYARPAGWLLKQRQEPFAVRFHLVSRIAL
jgi:hypothetical protein